MKKFKMAFITPTKFINKFGKQGDFTLALSHLIDLNKETEYEKAIKKAKLPIILDNGLFENHKPEPLESLVKKALKVKATHFFAPDILYSTKGTKKEVGKAITFLKKHRLQKKIKLAAVVQGQCRGEYIGQLLDFNSNPNIDLIGLSILSIPKSFRAKIVPSRIDLMKRMIAMKEDGIVWKNMHLLGLGDSYEDVLFAKKYCPWIVSNDTSCCFQTGLFKKKLTNKLAVPGGKVKEKVNFSLDSITKEQAEKIQFNINQVKKQCR